MRNLIDIFRLRDKRGNFVTDYETQRKNALECVMDVHNTQWIYELGTDINFGRRIAKVDTRNRNLSRGIFNRIFSKTDNEATNDIRHRWIDRYYGMIRKEMIAILKECNNVDESVTRIEMLRNFINGVVISERTARFGDMFNANIDEFVLNDELYGKMGALGSEYKKVMEASKADITYMLFGDRPKVESHRDVHMLDMGTNFTDMIYRVMDDEYETPRYSEVVREFEFQIRCRIALGTRLCRCTKCCLAVIDRIAERIMRKYAKKHRGEYASIEARCVNYTGTACWTFPGDVPQDGVAGKP